MLNRIHTPHILDTQATQWIIPAGVHRSFKVSASLSVNTTSLTKTRLPMALQIMKVSMELAFSGTAWHANKSMRSRGSVWWFIHLADDEAFWITAYEDGKTGSKKHKYQQLGIFVKDYKPVIGEKTASKQPLKMQSQAHVHTLQRTHMLPSVLFNSKRFNPPVSIF